MSGSTSIEWTDASWNPVRGCSRISPGCVHCYAEQYAARFSDEGRWGHGYAERTKSGPRWTGKVDLLADVGDVNDVLSWPARYRGHSSAIAEDRPTRIFVNSTSDLFHERLVFEGKLEPIDAVFAGMVLAAAFERNHIFQVLTKRSHLAHAYMTARAADQEPINAAAFQYFGEENECHVANSIGGCLGEGRNALWPPRNVWLGASVEDRLRKDRIDQLRETPAAVRFLSLEPLLENLGHLDLTGIDWVIVGGESGHGARPCDLFWVREIVRQCIAAGVPVFVKQLGAHVIENGVRLRLTSTKGGDMDEWPHDLRIRQMPPAAHRRPAA